MSSLITGCLILSPDMGSFLYFGYGSNLLRQRLRLQNPSAEFVCTAVLENYKLTFTNFGRNPLKTRWKGAGANIKETEGEKVWGCVWRLKNGHRETLDRQEGSYKALEVQVTGNDGTVHICRTYQAQDGDTNEEMRPSPFYMDVIIKGAKQNGICAEYINFLESIEQNSETETPQVYKDTMDLLEKDLS